MENTYSKNSSVIPGKLNIYRSSPEDRKDAEMNAGIKPIIHQSELKVVPFALLFCCIVTNTEWNGIIKIDN
jgi:hypothetical protein